MAKTLPAENHVLDRGTISFTIESRILRELGERLVKQPEVAIVELIKKPTTPTRRNAPSNTTRRDPSWFPTMAPG